MGTKITSMLGIKYPIMQGAMQHLGVPDLASTVCNAGALGSINATIYPKLDDLRSAIREMKERTKNPFSLNISMLPGGTKVEGIEDVIKLCGVEGVPIIETAGGSDEYVASISRMIKDNCKFWMKKVQTPKDAMEGIHMGADIVTLIGFEAGGHPGMQNLGTLAAGNYLANVIGDAPFILGGGITDGKSVAAALALGASAALIATGFIATRECTIHENFKKWIVSADIENTVLIEKSINFQTRVADNEAARNCLKVEREKGSKVILDDLMPIISGKVGKAAYISGDINAGIFPVGEGVGNIKNIKTVKSFIDDIMIECNSILKNQF